MAGASRPILIIDTNVFVKDALSKNRAGAASQILALAPAIAYVVTCDDIVEEIVEKIPPPSVSVRECHAMSASIADHRFHDLHELRERDL